MRQRGSVRFAPFYTLQWYDDISMCWRDVKRSARYPTIDDAWAASPPAVRVRVARTDPSGCTIIERVAQQQAAR